MPVRLSAFDARKSGNDARLEWKVVCFLQYARFEIERSYNAINYISIRSFEADQARCGQPFDFTDANVTGKVFYRIKVGDRDGRVYQSKTVTISAKMTGFEINSIIPSVFSATGVLSISSATECNAAIRIFNFQGVMVSRFSVKLNPGVTQIPVHAETFAGGNYILSITDNSSDIKTIRFAKR